MYISLYKIFKRSDLLDKIMNLIKEKVLMKDKENISKEYSDVIE